MHAWGRPAWDAPMRMPPRPQALEILDELVIPGSDAFDIRNRELVRAAAGASARAHGPEDACV
jgi:hypothetical protein